MTTMTEVANELKRAGYNDSIDDLRKEWSAYSSFVFKQMAEKNSSEREKNFLKVWHSFIIEDLNRITND